MIDTKNDRNNQNSKFKILDLFFSLWFNIFLIICIIVLVNILRIIFIPTYSGTIYAGANIFEIIVNILSALIFIIVGWIFIAFFESHSYNVNGPVGVTKYTINPGMGLLIGGVIALFGVYIIYCNIF